MSDYPIVDLSTDGLLTMTTGTTFRRAKRIPVGDVLHFDRW